MPGMARQASSKPRRDGVAEAGATGEHQVGADGVLRACGLRDCRQREFAVGVCEFHLDLDLSVFL